MPHVFPDVETGVVDPYGRSQARRGTIQNLPQARHPVQAPGHGDPQRAQVEPSGWSGLIDEQQRGNVHRQTVVLDAQVAQVHLAEPLNTAGVVHARCTNPAYDRGAGVNSARAPAHS